MMHGVEVEGDKELGIVRAAGFRKIGVYTSRDYSLFRV